jgi:hypothetical protein
LSHAAVFIVLPSTEVIEICWFVRQVDPLHR